MMKREPVVSFLNGLFEGTLPPLSEEEYFGVAEDIFRFDISPQVCRRLDETGISIHIPPGLLRRLQAHTEQVKWQNFYIKSRQKSVLSAFEEAGIPVILLKGTRLAERYFGGLEGRGTTDIDLLLRKGDREQAGALLARLGFRKAVGDPGHFHDEYVSSRDSGREAYPLCIEVHWNIAREDMSDTDTESLWEEAVGCDSYKHIYELGRLHTFYHLCLHGMNHHMMSLKYLLDVVRLVHEMAGELDYEQLLLLASKDRNGMKMRIALSLAYELFPHLHSVKPLPEGFSGTGYPGWSLELARKVMTGRKNVLYSCFRLRSSLAIHDTWGYRAAQIAFLLWGLPKLWIRKRVWRDRYFKPGI